MARKTALQQLALEYLRVRRSTSIYNHECEKIDHGLHVLPPRGFSPRQAVVYHLPVIVVAELGASIRPAYDEIKAAASSFTFYEGRNRLLIEDVADVAGLCQLIADGT